MKRLILISSLLCITLWGCRLRSSQENLVDVTPNTMQELLVKTNEPLIIDVRTPEEYQEGHLENAVNIDFYSDTFAEEIKKLDSKKAVFIYCKSGGRSGRSIEQFKAAGFTKIYNLKGGYLGWKEQDFKVSQ